MRRVLEFMRLHWAWVSSFTAVFLGGVIWLHSQHKLLEDTNAAVKSLPEQVQRMVSCHRHHPDGRVYFQPCAFSESAESANSPGGHLHGNSILNYPRFLAGMMEGLSDDHSLRHDR